jgi:predicted transporter
LEILHLSRISKSVLRRNPSTLGKFMQMKSIYYVVMLILSDFIFKNTEAKFAYLWEIDHEQ